jgi:hypothetical protein
MPNEPEKIWVKKEKTQTSFYLTQGLVDLLEEYCGLNGTTKSAFAEHSLAKVLAEEFPKFHMEHGSLLISQEEAEWGWVYKNRQTPPDDLEKGLYPCVTCGKPATMLRHWVEKGGTIAGKKVHARTGACLCASCAVDFVRTSPEIDGKTRHWLEFGDVYYYAPAARMDIYQKIRSLKGNRSPESLSPFHVYQGWTFEQKRRGPTCVSYKVAAAKNPNGKCKVCGNLFPHETHLQFKRVAEDEATGLMIIKGYCGDCLVAEGRKILAVYPGRYRKKEFKDLVYDTGKAFAAAALDAAPKVESPMWPTTPAPQAETAPVQTSIWPTDDPETAQWSAPVQTTPQSPVAWSLEDKLVLECVLEKDKKGAPWETYTPEEQAMSKRINEMTDDQREELINSLYGEE